MSGPTGPFRHWDPSRHWGRFAYHPGAFHGFYGGPPRFRLFHRLFWMGIGAGVYAFWNRHDQWHKFVEGQEAKVQEECRKTHCASHWGWRRHQRMQQQQEQQQQQQQQQQPGCSVGQAQVWPTQSTQPVAPQPAPTYTPTAPVYDASPSNVQQSASTPRADVVSASDWNSDHIKDAKKQVSDAFADISENALDSLLTNIQSLKTKLAEARTERETEKMRLEQRANKSEYEEPKRLV